MSYYGSWKIDDALTLTVNTHDPSDGSATDADSVPAYRVYEDETGTPILTGTMAKLDDANTTGFYSEQITLSAANGLEKGKSYNVYISAAVGGTTGTISHTFQVEAEVDANVVSDKSGYSISGTKQTLDALNDVTAAAVVNEWETQSQADPTGFHVNVLEVGGTPQTGNDNGADINAILADTADMQPKLGTPAGVSMSADIAAVKTDTGNIETDTQDIQTQVGTAGAGLTDLGGMSTAMKAEVNAEAKDVIATDTIAEMTQGAPSATPTLEDAIMYLYMALRNKIDITAALKEFHNDAGAVIWKKALSDDGTTYSEAEGATGP